MALIKLNNIVKDYPLANGKVFEVLRGVTMSIDSGEFVAIMGPSGSGKSTLMNILGCLDKASHGEYWLKDQLVSQLDRKQLSEIRRQQIGFVFQSFNLLARRSVLDNVCLPMIYTRTSKPHRYAMAKDMLALVGLSDYMYQLPTQLSGGQKQRVAIARSLVNQSQLILADEPTGNLDSKTSTDIMLQFKRLNRELGITLLIVTHEDEVASYAKRLIRIKDGCVGYDGATPC